MNIEELRIGQMVELYEKCEWVSALVVEVTDALAPAGSNRTALRHSVGVRRDNLLDFALITSAREHLLRLPQVSSRQVRNLNAENRTLSESLASRFAEVEKLKMEIRVLAHERDALLHLVKEATRLLGGGAVLK